MKFFDNLETIKYLYEVVSPYRSSDCFAESPLADSGIYTVDQRGKESGLSISSEHAYSGTKSFKIQRSLHAPARTQIELRTSAERYKAGQMIYLPSDFALTSPTNKWFNLGSAIYEWADSNNTLRVSPTMYGENLKLSIAINFSKDGFLTTCYVNTDVNLIDYLGRYFKLHWEVYRHPTEGYAKFYLNDNLIATWDKNSKIIGDRPPTVTKYHSETCNTIIVKHYCDINEKENTIYFDDIFFDDVEPPPEPPPSEDGAALAILIFAAALAALRKGKK